MCNFLISSMNKNNKKSLTYLSNPIMMPGKSTYTITSRNLPDLNGSISRARHHMISTRSELNRRYIVIMALKGLGTRVRLVKVPQPYRHVSRARGEHSTTRVERHVLHYVRVAFQAALEVARLVVPDFYGRVLRARHEQRVDRVEDDACHRRSVPLSIYHTYYYIYIYFIYISNPKYYMFYLFVNISKGVDILHER